MAMTDKEKRILVFNLYFPDTVPANDIMETMNHVAEDLYNRFDDTVMPFVCRTWDKTKDAVQVVSDFPIEGHEALKSILESDETEEEKINRIKEILNNYESKD